MSRQYWDVEIEWKELQRGDVVVIDGLPYNVRAVDDVVPVRLYPCESESTPRRQARRRILL